MLAGGGSDDAREWTAQKELLRGPDQAPSISPTGHDEMRPDRRANWIIIRQSNCNSNSVWANRYRNAISTLRPFIPQSA